ncbi:MAG TPA: NAD(P)H-dependent oxidoreductase [Bacteroidales bacterium]|jgi:NAD(P)H dehydrogenase (quinone)|nr:NAD(P)H-dependent oxidoreductase [Bacteroidales bacterium]
MKHHIIYANHNDGSFNHAVKNKIEETLKNAGHEVFVSDLYAMQFNPVLTSEDLKRLYAGEIAPEIKAEQNKIAEADVLVIIYPVWWTSMPAILKGYIDRVFQYGFAYKAGSNGIEGMLHGKKVVLFSSTGQPKEAYQNGMYNAMNMTTNTGIFEFCGIEVLDHVYFPSIMTVTDEIRSQYIEQAAEVISRLSPAVK